MKGTREAQKASLHRTPLACSPGTAALPVPSCASSLGRNATSDMFYYLHFSWRLNCPGQRECFPSRLINGNESWGRPIGHLVVPPTLPGRLHVHAFWTDTCACLSCEMFEADDSFSLIPVNTMQ